MLLKKRIEASKHDFDYILMDCPPSLGLLTINALAVANEVMIPMQPHFLALQGVAKLLETVQLVNKRMNPGLKVGGIVLTMFDAQTKLSIEVVNELNGFIEEAKGKPLPWANARIFNTKIRRNIKLAESPSFGQTILTYDSASNGANDYRALAAELISMEPKVVVPVTAPATVKKITAKPQAAKVSVSVNPQIDPSKLAAASVPSPAPAPASPQPAPASVAQPKGAAKASSPEVAA
jgi:chromosome partitioning protein